MTFRAFECDTAIVRHEVVTERRQIIGDSSHDQIHQIAIVKIDEFMADARIHTLRRRIPIVTEDASQGNERAIAS